MYDINIIKQELQLLHEVTYMKIRYSCIHGNYDSQIQNQSEIFTQINLRYNFHEQKIKSLIPLIVSRTVYILGKNLVFRMSPVQSSRFMKNEIRILKVRSDFDISKMHTFTV